MFYILKTKFSLIFINLLIFNFYDKRSYEKLRKLLLINCEKWKQIRERKIQISNLIQTLYS